MLWLVALPPPGFGTFATEPAAQAERLSRTSYSGGTGGGDDYIKKNDDEMEYSMTSSTTSMTAPSRASITTGGRLQTTPK